MFVYLGCMNYEWTGDIWARNRQWRSMSGPSVREEISPQRGCQDPSLLPSLPVDRCDGYDSSAHSEAEHGFA